MRAPYAEYLAAEAASDVRHEYLNGEVWAMAGGTPEHAALAEAISRELGVALRGKPCRTYSSDLRVRVVETGLSTCRTWPWSAASSRRTADDQNAAVNPFALVSQAEPPIEVRRRSESGRWEILDARPGESIEPARRAARLLEGVVGPVVPARGRGTSGASWGSRNEAGP